MSGMMFSFMRRRKPHFCEHFGFSLLELLAVITILSLLMLAAVPAISSMQRGFDISKAGVLIRDQLLLARQLAIANNTSIFACLCETDGGAGRKGFNMLVLARAGTDGVFEPITKASHLPNGVALSTDTQWSSLKNLSQGEVKLGASKLACRYITFKPTGSAALSSSQEWFLTIYPEESVPEQVTNFVTVAIDPVTGRVFSYQP